MYNIIFIVIRLQLQVIYSVYIQSQVSIVVRPEPSGEGWGDGVGGLHHLTLIVSVGVHPTLILPGVSAWTAVICRICELGVTLPIGGRQVWEIGRLFL